MFDTRGKHHSVLCFLQLSHMWEKTMTDIWGEKRTVPIISSCEDITGVPDKASLLSQPYISIQNPAELTSRFFATTLWDQKSSIIAAIQRLANDCWSLPISFSRIWCVFLIDAHSKCRQIFWRRAKLPSDLMSCHWYTTNYMSTDPHNIRYVNLNAHLFTPD